MGLTDWGNRLYEGEKSYDFIARRKVFYLIALALVLLSLGSFAVRGFSAGIEFRGGATFQFPAGTSTTEQVRSLVEGEVDGEIIVQQVGNDFRVQTGTLANEDEVTAVQSAIAQGQGLDVDQVSPSTVSSTWGGQITTKAIQGLVAFLIAVTLYISFRFEPRMAAAAIVALLHDLVLTAGVYSLFGFEVTPATVIALLTILGYSLYDTVVVFDKVQENTRSMTGSNRLGYAGAANFAINQTLVRSINTSVIALLPVAGLLFIGAGLLGAGTLKDLSLALFIGIAAGTYSSIFIATPLLVDLKNREPGMTELRAKAELKARRQTASTSGGPTAAGGTATAMLDAPADTETPASRPKSANKPGNTRPVGRGKHGRKTGKRRR